MCEGPAHAETQRVAQAPMCADDPHAASTGYGFRSTTSVPKVEDWSSRRKRLSLKPVIEGRSRDLKGKLWSLLALLCLLLALLWW